jgi:DNA-binding transcriptional LysR family regulator
MKSPDSRSVTVPIRINLCGSGGGKRNSTVVENLTGKFRLVNSEGSARRSAKESPARWRGAFRLPTNHSVRMAPRRDRNVDLVVGRVFGIDTSRTKSRQKCFLRTLASWWSVRKIPWHDVVKLPFGTWHTSLGRYLRMRTSWGHSSRRRFGLRADPPVTAVACGTVEMQTALLTQGPCLALYPCSVLNFSAARLSVKVLPVELPLQPPPVGILTWRNRTISPVVELFISRFRAVAKPLMQSERRSAKWSTDSKGAPYIRESA